MKVSYEEGLANNFGLQRRGGPGDRTVLSVRAKGNAGQTLSSDIITFVCRSCCVREKARKIPWGRFHGDTGLGRLPEILLGDTASNHRLLGDTASNHRTKATPTPNMGIILPVGPRDRLKAVSPR